MSWNPFSLLIVVCSLILVAVSIPSLFSKRQPVIRKYLAGLLFCVGMTIIQVILIDAKVPKVYPWVYAFYLPYQFLAPVFFSAFTAAYLGRMWEFKKYKYWLLLPFVVFFVLYIVLKVNAAKDYSLFSQGLSQHISAVWDENLALLFALCLGLWNYKMIKSYERGLKDIPHSAVVKRTYWLRVMFTVLVALCLLWILVIVYLNVNKFGRGMTAYYPLWTLFLIFYFAFAYFGKVHLSKRSQLQQEQRLAFQSVATDFQLEGLNKVFGSEELETVESSSYEVTAILSYFATSLFDKKSENTILWDIVKNCISKLDLEDCVVYMLDEEREVLVQKAAYGNKDKGSRKILSPIEIPVGQGIVGSVLETSSFELITDVSEDNRYILDDKQRRSELAVVIKNEDEVFGVLDSEHSQQFFFNQRHLFLFQLIAKLTAAKLSQVAKKSTLTLTNDNAYYKELCYLLETEKIYKDPELSLVKIADRLHISVSYISQLINKVSGANFSDFVNDYRVKEAQRFLTHPNYSGYPILSIGLEAGFNSKSAFYAAFKKHTGLTPSVYRANAPFPS